MAHRGLCPRHAPPFTTLNDSSQTVFPIIVLNDCDRADQALYPEVVKGGGESNKTEVWGTVILILLVIP